MHTLPKVSINITLDMVIHSTPLQEPHDDQLRCELWVCCENPRCFKHGCLNALRRQMAMTAATPKIQR